MFTEKGKYTWDMSELLFTPYEETIPTRLYGAELFNIEKMYSSQMEDFVGFVKGSKSNNATFGSAKKVVEIIETVEK